MERRAAQRVSPDALAPKGAIESMWRRSALHPLCVGRRAGREYGRARAVKRIGPAELGCLKFGPVIPARERLGMSEKILIPGRQGGLILVASCLCEGVI